MSPEIATSINYLFPFHYRVLQCRLVIGDGPVSLYLLIPQVVIIIIIIIIITTTIYIVTS
jgi:hypothetical protein